MKIILLLVTILFVNNVFSQTFDIYKRKPWEDQKDKMKVQKLLKIDRFKYKPAYQPGDTTFDKSVVKIGVSKEFVSNNGMGSDVYKMKPYNMPCLIPDSTFHSNMPVKSFTTIQH